MNTRYKKIIELLIENEFLSAASLAKKLQTSGKTMRNDIKDMRYMLKNNGAQIVSMPGSGFQLVIHDKGKFNSFIEEIEDDDETDFSKRETRVVYILRYFLMNLDRYVKLDDLSEMMNVSKTSFNRDFKEVKEILSVHNVTFESKPGKGIKVVGEEYNIRICIADYIAKNDSYFLNISVGDERLNKIIEAVDSILARRNFEISEFQHQNLIIHLYVAMLRIEKGKSVQIDEQKRKELENYPEYRLAKEIVEELSKTQKVEISDDEAIYVTIHLAAKKAVRLDELQSINNYEISDEIHALVMEILEHIFTTYCLDFRNDLDLILTLCLHFVTLDVRLKYELNLINPILEDIKSHYQLAFMMTKSCVNEVIMKRYHKSISDDEIAYIALHINLAIERMKTNVVKKNILIVCSTGAGTSELLKYEYQRRFKDSVNKIYVIDPQGLKDFDFNKVDYILSTINLNILCSKPILLVHPLMNKKDIELVDRHLRDKFETRKFFSEKLFFTDLKAKTYEEVIQTMVNRIADVKKLPGNFVESVFERESMGNTNLTNLVAFPHPNKPLVDETFVAIGILEKPIVHNEKKIQLLYMFALTKHSKEKEIPTLYRVTGEILTDEMIIEKIISTKSFEKFVEIVQNIESNLGE